MSRPISVIAKEIAREWSPVNFAAKPYLIAMLALDTLRDTYGAEDARSIVLYFLSNASTWRGPKAREIKAELNKLLKGAV